jgi:hypothetical protein
MTVLRKVDRNAGIDLARAVAIIGMGAVHFAFAGSEAASGGEATLPEGPRDVAILFVLVAGLGVSLLDRARSGARDRTRRRLLWRSIVLLPLGLALQELPHGLAVILQDFAVLFVLGAIAVGLTDRALAVLTAAWFAVGPLLHVAAEATWSGVVFGDPPGLLDPPLQIAGDLLVSGTYPLVNFGAVLLLGMWVGRRDVTSPVLQARLLAVGAVLGLGLLWGGLLLEAVTPTDAPTWWALAVADGPLAQSPVWLWRTTAASAAALGACLVIGDLAPRLLSPLVALGQLALTVYVAHLLVIAVDVETMRVADVVGVGLRVAAFTVLSAGFARLWQLRWRRGPLEWLLDAPLAAVERRLGQG